MYIFGIYNCITKMLFLAQIRFYILKGEGGARGGVGPIDCPSVQRSVKFEFKLDLFKTMSCT